MKFLNHITWIHLCPRLCRYPTEEERAQDFQAKEYFKFMFRGPDSAPNMIMIAIKKRKRKKWKYMLPSKKGGVFTNEKEDRNRK